MMRKKNLLFSLALLVVGILCGFPSTNVAARMTNQQPQQISCNPVDLIFLVDHTAKMQQVDPNDLRLKTIQWAIMLLGYDHMYYCPDTSYRVGVISYGGRTPSNVNKDIPLTDVTPRLGQGLDSWRSEWGRLVDQLKVPAGSNSRNLLDAIQTANGMLDSASDGRKQALVIFNADWGSPCYLGNDCVPADAEKMIKESAHLLPTLGANRSLHFYAFPDDSPADLEYYAGETWEKHLNEVAPDSAKFIRVEDTSATYGPELAKRIADIFFSANNRSGIFIDSGCSLVLPPFVKKMGFLIYKMDGTVPTAIDDSDPLTPAIGKNSTAVAGMRVADSPHNAPTGNVEPFIIDRPMPGDWQIRQCTISSMYVLHFYFFADSLEVVDLPSAGLPQYSDPNLPNQLFDANQEFHLEFKVTDDNGESLIQYEGAMPQPNIDGQITMPDGKKQTIKFDYDAKAVLYRSKDSLPTRQIDIYAWEITFRRNAQAEPIILKGEYEVKKVTPIRLIINLPFANSTTVHDPCLQLNCFMNLQIHSFQVSAKFINENNASQSIPFRELFPNSKETIETTLTHIQSGKRQIVSLQPSLTDPYIFEATTGDQLDLAGEYLVEASLRTDQISRMNNLYRFFSDSLKSQVQFMRTDTVQTHPNTYILILVAVGFIIFVMLLRLIWAFSNPVDGNLVFYRLALSTESSNDYRKLVSIPLYARHLRYRVFNQKEISKIKRLLNHFAYIKARKIFNSKGNPGIEVKLQINHVSVQDRNRTLLLYQSGLITEANKLPGGIYVAYEAVDMKADIAEKADPAEIADATEPSTAPEQ